MAESERDITRLLNQYAAGQPEAFTEIFQAVYDQLKAMARKQLRGNRRDRTLGATALVNEAYLKLAASDQQTYVNRKHFYGVAAMAMRQIIVDQARQKGADKRRGQLVDISVNEAASDDPGAGRVLAIERALQELETEDAEAARVFTCKYFGGFSTQETAEIVDSSVRTVERNWQRAREFLRERV